MMGTEGVLTWNLHYTVGVVLTCLSTKMILKTTYYEIKQNNHLLLLLLLLLECPLCPNVMHIVRQWCSPTWTDAK